MNDTLDLGNSMFNSLKIKGDVVKMNVSWSKYVSTSFVLVLLLQFPYRGTLYLL